MNPSPLLLLIAPTIMLVMLIIFWTKGKRALEIFPSLDSVNARFSETGASGQLVGESIFKSGGASRILHVIVTDQELWIKSHAIFAWLLNKNRMLHKLKFNRIIRTEKNKKKYLELYLLTENNQELHLRLQLKNEEAFILALPKEKRC